MEKTDPKEKFYMALIDTSGGIFIYCDDDHHICAAKTEGEAIEWFEKTYKRKHQQSFEGSMSACINWMQFQPSIVHMSLSDIKKDLIDESKVEPVSMNSVSGFMKGIKVTFTKNGKKYWDKGTKPQLIREH